MRVCLCLVFVELSCDSVRAHVLLGIHCLRTFEHLNVLFLIFCAESAPKHTSIEQMKSEKAMDKSSNKAELDSVEFEKRLTNLKDTQDSIQALSAWCLQNRSHHKKIVASWLLVLKQGKTMRWFDRTFFSLKH